MCQDEGFDLEALTDAGAILGLDVSPDGRSIVFASTAGGGSHLYTQSLDGGDPIRLTHGARFAAQPKWSPTGEWIAYLKDVDGDENDQVEEDATLYYERSPIHFVDNIRSPLLILQVANDPRIPLAEAEQIHARLDAAGKPHEYVVYPDEGHGFARRTNELDAIRRLAAFFDGHLAVQA